MESKRHIGNELDHSFYTTTGGKILDEFYTADGIHEPRLITREISLEDLPSYLMPLAVTKDEFLKACFRIDPGLGTVYPSVGCEKISGWNVIDYANKAARGVFLLKVPESVDTRLLRAFLKELDRTGVRPSFLDERR